MEKKNAEQIFYENGFTDEILLPKHLVLMLMNKHASQIINNNNICPKCKSENITTQGKDRWCDDCGNVWR